MSIKGGKQQGHLAIGYGPCKAVAPAGYGCVSYTVYTSKFALKLAAVATAVASAADLKESEVYDTQPQP
jgi:hypothetical protein